MFINTSTKLTRLLTSSVVAGMLIFGVFSGGNKAEASRSVCRTDPIVTLSNGLSVQLIADVESDDAIKNVSYDFHIPSNVQVTSIWYDPKDALPETVTVHSDNATDKYSGTAAVNMKSSKDMGWIKVTVTVNKGFTTMMSGDSQRPVQFDFTSKNVQQRP